MSSILNISNTSDLSSIQNVSQSVTSAATEEEVTQKTTSREDTYVKSSEDSSNDSTGIYSRETILEELKNSEAKKKQAFIETITGMLTQQSQKSGLASKKSNLTSQLFNITDEMRAEAQASISEGGEYSVESVTERIMDMAKSLAGDDPTKIETLKNAVIEGFKRAGYVDGDKNSKMPEITKNTYNSIMKAFDEWENSYKTDTDEEQTDVNAAE